MLRKRLLILPVCLLFLPLSGCWSQMTSLSGGSSKTQEVVDELRSEVAELKHTLHAYEVDMQILDEKLAATQTSAKGKSVSDEKMKWITDKLSYLETRFSQMQNFQESCLKDLKVLRDQVANTNIALSEQKDHFSLIEKSLDQHTQKIENFKELKTTLNSIKKAMSENSPVSMGSYKVCPGDTLEKIAKKTGMTLEELRSLNHLTSDQILIGQTLKILHDQHD